MFSGRWWWCSNSNKILLDILSTPKKHSPKIRVHKKYIFVYFPQDNNFDSFGSSTLHNPDFHETTWEYSSPNDKSRGLFRVNFQKTVYLQYKLSSHIWCGFNLLFLDLFCTVVKLCLILILFSSEFCDIFWFHFCNSFWRDFNFQEFH